MFNRRPFLVATAIVGAGLVSGCVTQQKYNSLQQAYNQLQAAYQGDEVEVKCLEVDPTGKIRLSRKAVL